VFHRDVGVLCDGMLKDRLELLVTYGMYFAQTLEYSMAVCMMTVSSDKEQRRKRMKAGKLELNQVSHR
jgi:hypothetical protein